MYPASAGTGSCGIAVGAPWQGLVKHGVDFACLPPGYPAGSGSGAGEGGDQAEDLEARIGRMVCITGRGWR